MFETPKPKQFRYQPRFYDPEKERWEALKQKYADQRLLESLDSEEFEEQSQELPESGNENAGLQPQNSEVDKDLEYFQRRVRELDRKGRSKLTWKDMFRKREMPKFNYQPRFANTGESGDTAEHLSDFKRRGVKIKRRFGNQDPDDNTLKPVPAGRIMLYALLATLLLYWIIS